MSDLVAYEGLATLTWSSELNPAEAARIELRAQHIYRGLPPLVLCGDTDEAARQGFRRRAFNLMLFDGSLLSGYPAGVDDYGFADLQQLYAEAAAVIQGVIQAGELWRPQREDDLPDGGLDHGN